METDTETDTTETEGEAATETGAETERPKQKQRPEIETKADKDGDSDRDKNGDEMETRAGARNRGGTNRRTGACIPVPRWHYRRTPECILYRIAADKQLQRLQYPIRKGRERQAFPVIEKVDINVFRSKTPAGIRAIICRPLLQRSMAQC